MLIAPLSKKKEHYILLSLILLVLSFYFFAIHFLDPEYSFLSHFYSTGDAKEYLAYSNWISGSSEYCNSVRTFFYPLLIAIFNAIGGVTAIWIFQLLIWLTGNLLIFKSIYAITKNTFIAIIGFVLSSTTYSLIVLTTHGLTEVTVFFLLALLSYIACLLVEKQNKASIFFYFIFVFSLLAVTKPLYMVIWYPIILGSIYVAIKKKTFTKKYLLILLITITPVLAQKFISIRINHTFNSVSIANSNLKNYFYRKLINYNEGVSFSQFDAIPDSLHESQKKQIEHTTDSEIVKYILQHPINSFSVFYHNLEDNIRSGHPYISREKNPSIWKWTQNLNDKFFYLHLGFTFIGLYFLIRNYSARRSGFYLLILFLFILNYYILYTSGLVFWAGDRLIVPAQGVWFILYALLIWYFVDIQKKKKQIS